MELLAAIFADQLDVLVISQEFYVAATDAVPAIGVALVAVRVAAGGVLGQQGAVAASTATVSAGDLVGFLELAVAVLHLDVIRGLARVYVWIGHVRAQISQLDLLGEAACASHDCCKEARIADLPELEGQIDSTVACQIIAFGVEAEAGDILGVPLQDLPLGACTDIIDTDRSIVRPHSQPLRVVVEGNHGEDLYHVREDHRNVLMAVFAKGQFVRIQASKQNLDYLDEVLF